MIITTRSIGFSLHNYPCDYWRFGEDDFKFIFSDFEISVIKEDISQPGIFIKAIKPYNFKELDLSKYELYNIIERKRTL